MNGARERVHVQYATSPDIHREDVLLEASSERSIFVRSLTAPGGREDAPPLLLLHGARASSVASFDLDVAGGSLAGDLARSGLTVYLMDARGYGGSSRPPEMDLPPGSSGPLVRSEEVVDDVALVVDFIRTERGANRIALMGWATGSQWLAHFASREPESVSHLVLYNALWPVRGDWPLGDRLEDPERPGTMLPDALAAYGLATEADLLQRWEHSIPLDNTDDWRAPEVATAYASAAVSADPTAHHRTPPSLRTPLGAIADSFLLSRGHQVFNPARITANVLGIRSELDFWSREVDLAALERDLPGASSTRCVTLEGATHFAHLDRPQHGRQQLLELVIGALS